MPSGSELDAFARVLLQLPAEADWLEASDPGRGILRIAGVQDGALEACLFLARNAAGLPAEAAAIAMLGAPVPDGARISILAGRMNGAMAPEGPKVCACFGVTRDAIRHAVVAHRMTTAGEVGAHLQAGTNCGSCIPEIEELLRDVRIPAE